MSFVAAGIAVLVASPGCTDLVVGADLGKYVEREEKHFPTTGKADVTLSTFDGSIEVRPWDKTEVQVIVEKRARDKAMADEIDVRTEQSGNHIVVEVKPRKGDNRGIHFGWNSSRSAKLIVSMPPSSDLIARSGDGSIDVERIGGRVELRSGDGSIRARQVGGDVTAHSGDGSIRVEDVNGKLDVSTGDGSIVVGGKLSSVRARSGDGSVTVRAEAGSSPASDWDINTGDGSVVLELPEDFGAEIDAHTGDGGIRMHDITISDVSGEIRRNTVRGRIGAGGKLVRIRTGDGSITLKKP
jgi:WD40 repeat protein